MSKASSSRKQSSVSFSNIRYFEIPFFKLFLSWKGWSWLVSKPKVMALSFRKLTCLSSHNIAAGWRTSWKINWDWRAGVQLFPWQFSAGLFKPPGTMKCFSVQNVPINIYIIIKSYTLYAEHFKLFFFHSLSHWNLATMLCKYHYSHFAHEIT